VHREVSGSQIHLMLPAAWRRQDIESTFRKYRCWKPDRIVVARADESRQYGAICGISAANRIPISFIASGGSMIDGVQDATLRRLLPPGFFDRTTGSGAGGRA
jgi:flagellar biosynthesis GTPase FlhF